MAALEEFVRQRGSAAEPMSLETQFITPDGRKFTERKEK